MKRTIGIFGIIAIFLGAAVFSAFVTSFTYKIDLASDTASSTGTSASSSASTASSSALVATTTEPVWVATHVSTPKSVRGVYMSSLYASNLSLREKLVDLIDTTELNTVVLDIKDSYGRISFQVHDPLLVKMGAKSGVIPDAKEFIAELHKKGIYVIGRIATFQDSYFAQNYPQYAVKTKTGAVWGDRKNVHWLDAGAEPVWDYIGTLAEEAHSIGFDEINFDYIRFPSDGDMENIAFPYSGTRAKPVVLNDFFTYIDHRFHPQGIPISADVFGMVTSARGDLGIGQVWENALRHFDYVSPMVYPSHYPAHFDGIANPNAEPYQTVFNALQTGVTRAKVLAHPPAPVVATRATSTKSASTSKAYSTTSTTSSVASVALALTVSTTSTTTSVATSSTPVAPIRVAEIRPWLQDFSLGKVKYTAELVRTQIDATYKNGLESWLLWNASNVYTKGALQ